jgi:signal peptidase II
MIPSSLRSWLFSWLWGPYAPLGLAMALATLAVDQAHKWWMLNVFGIEGKGRVAVLPFLDVKLTINTGVSFSMLDSAGTSWQLALAGFAALASLALWMWLCRGPTSRLSAAGLGLIIGGAVGNAIDRVSVGGVIDYVLPHAFGIDWPTVFNIADMAIVAGVAGLLYESLFTSRNDAANPL